MQLKHLLVCTFALFSSVAFAQNINFSPSRGEQKLSISAGVTAGLNLSTLLKGGSDIKPGFSMRPGFNAGVAVNLRFLKRNARSTVETGLLAIQPEVLFSTMGANGKEGNLSLSFITVPVMFQYYPINNLYIEVGPELAINVGHSPDNLSVNNQYQLGLAQLKMNDVMLGAGIGYKFGGFGIGIRYNQGFYGFAENLPWMNSCIQLNLSYLFRFKKKQAIMSEINF